MKKNTMKAKLAKGDVVTGVVVGDLALSTVEILAIAGFDFVFIDCEHSPLSYESVTGLVMAAENRGVTPLIRTPQNLAETIGRYMDTGASGIIIPSIRSSTGAKQAVMAVKYPPLGERGLAGVRAADYGLGGPLGEYVKIANEETMVLGVLEDIKGVENIEMILDSEGFDGVFIGTNDLSKSLGVPGQTNHPKVQNAVDSVLNSAIKRGKAVGGVVRAGENPKQYVEKGFSILLTSVQSLLATSAKAFLIDARRSN